MAGMPMNRKPFVFDCFQNFKLYDLDVALS